MQAQKSYTPFAMLAFLAAEFVTGNAMPAINDNGEPVYELTNNEKVEGGCFAYTVAKLHPGIINRLREVGTHAGANVEALVAEGTEILDTLDAPEWGDGRRTDFLQALQNVHDEAARQYYRNLRDEGRYQKIDDPVVAAAALALFRARFNAGLERVRRRFNVTAPIAAAIAEVQAVEARPKAFAPARRYGC